MFVCRTTRRHPATSSRVFFPLHLFSTRSCHRLSNRRTSSICPVLLLPGKHFASVSPSIVARTTLSFLFQWQYLESFRCLICSKMPFLLVYQSSQVLQNPCVLSIRRHSDISKAVSVLTKQQRRVARVGVAETLKCLYELQKSGQW